MQLNFSLEMDGMKRTEKVEKGKPRPQNSVHAESESVTKVGGQAKSLSHTKKRKSISEVVKQEKTKKKNVVMRTTVLNPRGIEWPEISEEEKNLVLSMIKSLANDLRIPIQKAPLNQIRKISKTERREFRKQWIINEAARLNFSIENVMRLRTSLAIGINCVSKALEIGELAAVLIDQNVNPPILTKLLVPLANAKNVPIIAFEGLKSTLQEPTHIQCVALGLKKSCEQLSHRFYPLLQMITKIVSGEYRQEQTEMEMESTESSPVLDHANQIRAPENGNHLQTIPIQPRKINRGAKQKSSLAYQSPKVRRANLK